MQAVIIADTSCLILLSKISELHVLQSLYGKITVTSIIALEYGLPLPEWVIIRDPINQLLEKKLIKERQAQ